MRNERIFNLLDIYCISIYDEYGNIELYVKKKNQKLWKQNRTPKLTTKECLFASAMVKSVLYSYSY